MILRKGLIVLLSLDPVKGSEIAKIRPAVVVSNDVCNEYSPVVTIVPCSTKLDKIYATEVLIKEGMDKPSKACADQIRTVDKTRIVKILGEISSTTMRQIENAIMIHLDIR